jgi:hypothetical protein
MYMSSARTEITRKRETLQRISLKRLRNNVAKAVAAGDIPAIADAQCELATLLRSIGKVEKALPLLEDSLHRQPDSKPAREELLLAYMDSGDAAAARALLDRFPRDASPVFAWTRVLVEFISHFLLEEEGSTPEAAAAALRAALTSNYHIGTLLAHQDAFTRAVDASLVDDLPKEMLALGCSVDAALRYCANSVSLWLDAEGACEWIADSEALAEALDEVRAEELEQREDGGEDGEMAGMVASPLAARLLTGVFELVASEAAPHVGDAADMDGEEGAEATAEEQGDEEYDDESEEDEELARQRREKQEAAEAAHRRACEERQALHKKRRKAGRRRRKKWKGKQRAKYE